MCDNRSGEALSRINRMAESYTGDDNPPVKIYCAECGWWAVVTRNSLKFMVVSKLCPSCGRASLLAQTGHGREWLDDLLRRIQGREVVWSEHLSGDDEWPEVIDG